jgi:nucleotide-binding universal stress UspA family protein
MRTTDIPTKITFDRILVATDFSPASSIATAYAVGIARHFSSTLEVLHIIDLSIVVPGIDGLLEPALEVLQSSGEEKLDQLAATISGVKIVKKVDEGAMPASCILNAAEQSRSELIVLGTTSKHGFEKLAFGSTAEEIIRSAACPVLTVGPHVKQPAPEPLSFQRIVYATDFSARAAKAAAYALALAQETDAHLYLCHVINDEKDDAGKAHTMVSLKSLVPESAYDWCTPECVVEQGKATAAILSLAARVDADLLVLGARKASFWLTYVHPGLTPSLLAEAKCPVLTVC